MANEDEDRQADHGRGGRRTPRREMVVPVAAVGALLSSLASTFGGFTKSEKLEAKLDIIGSRISAIEITVAKMGALEAQNQDLRERIKELDSRLREVERKK